MRTYDIINAGPKNRFMANGRIVSNSGAIVQLQNLYRNSLPDLNAARTLVRNNDYETVEMLYDSVPDVLAELVRTAFIPKPGMKFVVADFSAIEARVLAWLAGEQWRMDLFKNGGDIYCQSASKMFKVPVVKHGVNGHLRSKGKIAELACGYGGGVGALKAMGALEMGLTEDELKPLLDAWRTSNPSIVKFWWDVDTAVKTAIQDKKPTEIRGMRFVAKSGMLFVTLPSGRQLGYVRPQIGENRFGGESITYMGIGATKKWERIETYGPKIVENLCQAVARDVLCNSMRNLRNERIVAHVHDELIIECPKDASVRDICERMGQAPDWAEGLILRADGYECDFYQKD